MEHLPNVLIVTVPHSRQQFDTCGDYNEEPTGAWRLRLSELPDWRYEACVLIHNLVEMLLTKHRGVDWGAVSEFSRVFPEIDPDVDKTAPHHREHRMATYMEMNMASMLGVNWDEYCSMIDSLEYKGDAT